MSKKGKKAKSNPSSTRTPSTPPTPHRPVVSLALVLFVPAMWLVLAGNLSVQTAALRFVGALLVSWFAARLVLATVSYCTTSGPQPKTAATSGDGHAPERRGRAGDDPGSTGPGTPGSPAGTDLGAGWPSSPG